MIKLNAHIGFLFTEEPFLNRFACAAQAGFRAVEFPSPYEYDAQQLRDLLQQHSLEVVQFATPMGDSKGLAARTGAEAEFREGLHKAVTYAQALNCDSIHLMSGVRDGVGGADSQTYMANVAYAVEYLADQGLRSLVEVICDAEVAGYFMRNFEMADAVFDRIASPNLKLILDTYHASLLGRNHLDCLTEWRDRLGHVQIADFPGRHEPGTGEENFDKLFTALNDCSYGGWVGCEYRPLYSTTNSLASIQRYLGAAGQS